MTTGWKERRHRSGYAAVYHSKGDIRGHWMYIYIPLLYSKPSGLRNVRDKTFPGYTFAYMRKYSRQVFTWSEQISRENIFDESWLATGYSGFIAFWWPAEHDFRLIYISLVNHFRSIVNNSTYLQNLHLIKCGSNSPEDPLSRVQQHGKGDIHPCLRSRNGVLHKSATILEKEYIPIESNLSIKNYIGRKLNCSSPNFM